MVHSLFFSYRLKQQLKRSANKAGYAGITPLIPVLGKLKHEVQASLSY